MFLYFYLFFDVLRFYTLSSFYLSTQLYLLAISAVGDFTPTSGKAPVAIISMPSSGATHGVASTKKGNNKVGVDKLPSPKKANGTGSIGERMKGLSQRQIVITTCACGAFFLLVCCVIILMGGRDDEDKNKERSKSRKGRQRDPSSRRSKRREKQPERHSSRKK